MIDSQHYISLSNLLDISFNVLVAIFFACMDNQDSDDGIVYKFMFPKSYSANSEYINKFFDKIKNKDEIYYRNIKIISHNYSNERIKQQSGGFILFPERYKLPKYYYEKIIIQKEDKKKIIEELDEYFNINISTIFPEQDKKSDLVRDKLKKYSKNNYIQKSENLEYEEELETFLDYINLVIKLEKLEKEDEDNKIRFLRKEEDEYKKFLKNKYKEKEYLEIEKILENKLFFIKRSIKKGK